MDNTASNPAEQSPLNTASAPQAGQPPAVPPHTQTQSTLAPTSEYVRYLLLALPARYSLRSPIEGFFGKDVSQGFKNFRDRMLSPFIKPHMSGSAKERQFEFVAGTVYDYALGLGSLWLTRSYANTVKHDIQSLFSETVGMDLGKPPEAVTFADIKHSDNRIIRRTIDNYNNKSRERYGADLLFFTRPLLRVLRVPFVPPVGDLMIGVKAAQALNDTWKRKTTLFEDLVSFVNNKINPRNGLGQPITQGEVFDLYQHYAEQFHPEKMFTNVLTGRPTSTERWAQSQPIFLRITELMNQTYAYKHQVTPDSIAADFALPKLVYLLGSDLIDPDRPAETLTAIEIANSHGIPAVKEMRAQLAQGVPLEQLQQHYNVTLPSYGARKPEVSEKNTVIPKGSTAQPDAAPVAKIDVSSIRHEAPQQIAQLGA